MAGRRPHRARRPAPRSQHFLRSDALAADLVRDAEIARGDLVLDIGAGSGQLTEQLARVAGHVVAIEVDPSLAHSLIVEWNVAVKRALPWPSTLNGVYWGAFFETTLARRLPRGAFAPVPAVDAGVLVVRRRGTPLVDPRVAAEYRRFVAEGFRKGLGHVARSRPGLISTRGRLARDLDAHEWAALFNSSSGARVRRRGGT